MSNSIIKYCPSTLSEGYNTYSSTALKRVFYGKKVNHVLPFSPPQLDEKVAEDFRQNRKQMSISGVQIKQSMRLEKNQLQLVEEGQQGLYILKPIPHRETIGQVLDLPANEHLTMQIARQVFKLNVAECAIIFFNNGEPAYITKRFDIAPNQDISGKSVFKKIGQEDFAALSGYTSENRGAAFKYEGAYENIALLMRKFVPAYSVEIEKFFSLVLFNYLFANGDAHLKNFSLQQTPQGDHILAPAYDLLNTRIHIENDTAMALKDGLFIDDYETKSFKANGFYAYDDFFEFAQRIGLNEKRAIRILQNFRTEHELIKTFIDRSFLSEKNKSRYYAFYQDRLKAINYSFEKRI
ncbi:serine/threonine-protein kinase HipA [Roseivirga ehrenbergii]|uniref:type II toxin-antitoxin system HipA family toxin n=1 Tax=Roseivirga ehrenbergii (strain DSM 102268 / JCM 13514 / KCTC 12282 / NCIMB 14502 / KMM 6017) TaxID=279360 RepID=UPI000A02A871|nr:HipA domain-containing protein [Roseivirga ehrenbergii]TCL01772.1 serine/threonine-protein kinase HipA [Roseivirga ehrenbergii]